MLPRRFLLKGALAAALCGLACVAAARSEDILADQQAADAAWVAAQMQQDIERLAHRLVASPQGALLGLSHDTDALAKNLEQLRALPAGQKTLLTPPFATPSEGAWFVVQGQLDLVSHLKGTSNAWAWDFVLKNAAGQQSDPKKSGNEGHFCWDQPVLAPAPGVVRRVENNRPDHPPSAVPKDGGNFVILDHLNGEATALWHFKQASVVVREGQRVQRGQVLGRCGDSGNSLYPHIHLQLDKWNHDTGKRTAAPATLGLWRKGREGAEVVWHKAPRRGDWVWPVPPGPSLPRSVEVTGD